MNTETVRPPEPVAAAPGIVGVRTTRIYCRPECRPGRAPLPANLVFFASVEAARAAGYRACKLCKPDEPVKTPEPIRYGVGSGPIGRMVIAMTDRGIASLHVLEGHDPAPALDRLSRQFPGSTNTE